MNTTFPIYAAGKFVTTDTPLLVHNSYDNSLVATTYLADQALLEEAIKGAEGVRSQLQQLHTHERASILLAIAHGMEAERDTLALLLAQEAAKPLRYAQGEIDRAIQTFLVAAEETKRIPGEIMSMDWTAPGNHKTGYIRHMPIGIVAGISPFNFPMNLAVHKIAPAIATGCPIILKPASSTPLSTLALARIIDNTDLPKGAVSILPMDRNTGNQLVTDERIHLLSFTGSPQVGWQMKKEAGKKKVVLELGGNAGVIITESANLTEAIPKVLLGSFAYSGQVCIHIQRVYVHRSHFDQVLAGLKTGAEALHYGAPTETTTDISHMIDENNAHRMHSWVQEAISQGAQLITGGTQEGSYYAPTILTQVPPHCDIVAEEAFGPVVVVEPFDTFEEALELINASKFGLQAGVFTQHIHEQYQAWEALEVGGVIINDVPSFRVDHMPYGGVKESGLGREGVKYAMMDMLEPRIMVVHQA